MTGGYAASLNSQIELGACAGTSDDFRAISRMHGGIAVAVKHDGRDGRTVATFR